MTGSSTQHRHRGKRKSPILSPAPIHPNGLGDVLFDEYRQKLFSPYLYTLIGKKIEHFTNNKNYTIFMIYLIIFFIIWFHKN